ncbi:MAG: helix-turn-helix transcriptional regulator [Polyangiales bacterium]
MDPKATATIDVAEAAYDLYLGANEWLPNLLEKGKPLFDHGLGCAAAIWAGQSRERQQLVSQVCVGSGTPELCVEFARAARDAGGGSPQVERARTSGVYTASECDFESPSILRALEKRLGCKDVLGISAIDPDLHGVGIHIPSPEFISLTRRSRESWQRLAAHIEAGHRLRRRLGCVDQLKATPVNELPLRAEALIDPKRFALEHAEGAARDKGMPDALREAAIRVDHARGRLRNENPEQALALWHGLVRGRWSLVDWFDSDGRRFIVVIPNPPGLDDPRGLTEREHQVATLAAQGETGKSITYRLGISRQRVSMLLRSAMHKLGVTTQAQLVMRMRGFRAPTSDAA